jgi:Na+/H+-dicarboxylate symporter
MEVVMRTLVLLIATAFLAACAGATVQTARAPLPKSEYEIDTHKIATVERQARMNWGRVYWMSLPRRKVDSTLADNN